MKRILTAIAAGVIFGWMQIVTCFFLAENPGTLGALVNPLRKELGEQPVDEKIHRPLRVFDRIRFSLSAREFEGFPVEAAGALGFSIWAFVVFLGTGLWILRATGLRAPPPLEALAVATSAGMGAWGLAVLALGVAGLLYTWVLVGALAAATAASLPVLRTWWGQLARDGPRHPTGVVQWGATILLAVAVTVGLLYTLTPAIQSDGLRYHLAAPQAWLREHRIVYLPFNAFTNFPFLIEMLFTLSLAVAGDLAAKMIHYECFLVCGLFVGLLAARLCAGLHGENETEPRETPRPAGAHSPLLAPLVFFTTPTALITAAWEFIDLGTALFFVAMIYALVRWHRAADNRDKRRWRWVAALFLGFLIGTKYTMLAMLIIVPVALVLELPSFAPSGRWDVGYWFRSSLIVGLAAGVVASPWFVKNAVLTGNPVYPLAWGVFDGGEWSEQNAGFYMTKSSLKGYHPRWDTGLMETLGHAIATPWEATIHWRQDEAAGRPGYEDHFLGPLYLLWVPLLLRVLMDLKHRAPGEGPLRLVALFALAFGALWYCTYQSNRLLIPALALLAVLVVYSVAVIDRVSRGLSKAALAVLFLVTLYNLEYAIEWVVRETGPPDPIPEARKPSAAAYLFGFQSRDEYIRKAFPPYGVFQRMPQYVRPGEKVLFVGDYRTFHCPVECRASDWFDTPLIRHYIRATPDNDALLDRLLDEGIAWIFFDGYEWALYKWMFYDDVGLEQQPAAFSLRRFTPEERERFDALFPSQAGSQAEDSTESHLRLDPVLGPGRRQLYRILPRQ